MIVILITPLTMIREGDRFMLTALLQALLVKAGET
jgi:hypothetical protein